MTFLPGELDALENLTAKRAVEPLFKTSEWDFDTLRRTYDAIAEILNVTHNQVATLLYRGKRRLRKQLDPDATAGAGPTAIRIVSRGQKP